MNTSSTLSRKKKVWEPKAGNTKASGFIASFLSELPQDLKVTSLDWTDPSYLFEKLSSNNPLIFLDAASSQKELPRSFIAWDPYLWVRGRHDGLLVKSESQKRWLFLKSDKPYELFRNIFQKIKVRMPRCEALGSYGVFQYEAGEYFEKLPPCLEKDQNYFEFIFPRQVLCFYHADQKINWYSLGENQPQLSDWFFRAGKRDKTSNVIQLTPQFSKKKFESIVERAKEYIASGDIYQANLSQDFSFRFKGDPILLYEKLRRLNPSPFSSFMRLHDAVVISSSPELLVRKKGDSCFTRPIAGTRPRGNTLKKTKKLSRNLLLSPKERAEHLMLLDLERNDLGRVCRYGSVKVEEQMVLEQYSHVIHIVSQVIGKMRAGEDVFGLIRALFPGGTITGCPKIRSMEIIHELESKPREFYTGSLGFLSFSGEAVFNIIIRTIVLKGNRGSLRVGAGIVADSNPSREYWETIQKGKAMFSALGVGAPKR